MKNIKDVVKDNYWINQTRLEKNYNDCLEDPMFKKVVNSLKFPNKELMKYTSKIEETCKELGNCANCKNILECKNEVSGYIYYPSIENENVIFNYVPCKKKKELDKQNMYQNNVYLFDMPKEIKNASMKDIYTDDPNRFEVIKRLKKYIDDYKKDKHPKGIYLTGNFGCGKSYLVSAMFNELAKSNYKVAIVYYPELLRSLKEAFSDDDSYQNKFNSLKRVDLLLLDDIGAETCTSWARDEVLGTILQYRMQEGLATFFTSNLTLKELEEHLSVSSKGIEKVKARRIIERIKQLTDEVSMISENKRK